MTLVVGGRGWARRPAQKPAHASGPDGSRHQGPFWPKPPLAVNSEPALGEPPPPTRPPSANRSGNDRHSGVTELRLYTTYPSAFGRVALIVLEEKGLVYDVEVVDAASRDHRRRHPFGKIPVLEHDRQGETLTIFESTAVARYVDEMFEGPMLQPSSGFERAQCDQWIEIAKGYAFPALMGGIVKPLMKGVERSTKPSRRLDMCSRSSRVVWRLNGG